jgi:hypothetical protein
MQDKRLTSQANKMIDKGFAQALSSDLKIHKDE